MPDCGVRPLRATFIVFGFFWGTWAVVALDVQQTGAFAPIFLRKRPGETPVHVVMAN